jgi:GNAT superfamily N-acetyltransferase
MDDPEAAETIRVRQATPEDYEAVVVFTENTWPEHGGDYIPDIYHEWIAGDGDNQRTVVATVGGTVAGICQGVILTDWEAWAQGMRVDPDYRGRGLTTTLCEALFEWAGMREATVCRNMVLSWNAAGLGGSRTAGFGPLAEFRWAHPEPDVAAEPALSVRSDPDGAWRYWQRSAARESLDGLALDWDESWAVSTLTHGDLQEAAERTNVFAVQDGRTRAVSYRVRDYEREHDPNGASENSQGETERWAEYAIGAWANDEAARSLFAAISADAAAIGADRTRVLIPETPRHVSDAALCRVKTDPEPDFVLEAALGD